MIMKRPQCDLVGRLFLAGLLIFALLAFLPLADCPACVDGIGSGAELDVVRCRVCRSKGPVPLMVRWRHLLIHR